MDYHLLSALVAFAFVATITPGPNNIMLASSGANFGFKRTIPHMLGIGIGFSFMLFLVGIGLIKIFDFIPLSDLILKTISIIYLLYLAFKIASIKDVNVNQEPSQPLSFIQAASFQWINPKAWTMALTTISIYAPSHNLYAIVFCAITFAFITLPVVSFWTMLGQKSRLLLSNQTRLRAFNFAMAALLIASIYPIL